MPRMDHLEVSRSEWNKQYSDGTWDYLCQPDEGARYSTILGYIRRYTLNGNVLDLGCGAGTFWDYLSEQEKSNYTGIDLSNKAIKLAKKRAPGSFETADILKYEPKEKYDAIIFNEVLYYLPEPLDIVKRYSRYLTPGGIIVVSMFLYPNIFDNEYKIVIKTVQALEKENSFLIMDKVSLTNQLKWERKWYLVALREKNNTPISFNIEQVFADKFRNYKMPSTLFKDMKGEEFFLRTKNNYSLYCMFFPQRNATKTVIISHGYVNHIPYLKYLNLFYKQGFNVMIYDMKGFGKSDGDATTYGYYEKYDLSTCIDWVIDRCGKEETIGLFGDDIGAAVSIQNMEIDKRASFCIADSSFDYLPKWLKKSMKRGKHITPAWLRYAVKSISYTIRTRLFYRHNSPIKAVLNIKNPILFIHGQDDEVVPFEMSEHLYAKKTGKKSIKIFENVNHVMSYIKYPNEYEDIVKHFLNEI